MIVHDTRDAAPDGFLHVNKLPEDRLIDLEIGLRGNDIPGLVKKLYAVSTPGSSSYGKHLSKEEAESYTRPGVETVREVNAWLSHHGIQSKTISPSGDRLQITLPVSKANTMLRTTFSTFQHAETGTESFQALSYSLPSQLDHMIESVEPTTSFPNPTIPPAVQTFSNSSKFDVPPCNQAITPGCLRQLYGIPAVRATKAKNILSVAGFLNEYANRQDLASFLRLYRPDLNGATFADQSIDGGQNLQGPGTAGLEANLDIQYTVGLVNFSPVVFLSSGLANINGFINMANYWLTQARPPTVVSISYGFNENQVSKGSATILCNLYAQLGSRGVSILYATGDGGVSGSRLSNTCVAFVPTFPASCPYVTAVGATGGFPNEFGAGLSSGGFSNYFGLPKYQLDAVRGYLNRIGSLYNGRFNRYGRAYPDISAQGLRIAIVQNQAQVLVQGTSASAPIFASIIALLNDRFISRTGRALGFLNPWIYMNPYIFNDIISGSNPGCSTSGFPNKYGWDPVTGFGTPNFKRIAAALGVWKKATSESELST